MCGKGEPEIDIRPSLGDEEGKWAKIGIPADDHKGKPRVVLAGANGSRRNGHVRAFLLPSSTTLAIPCLKMTQLHPASRPKGAQGP